MDTLTTRLNLRPLGVGELLDRAIRLYRRNFLTFIGIIAVVQIPLMLLSLGISIPFFTVQGADSLPETGLGVIVGVGVVSAVVVAVLNFILLQGVATAVITRAVADAYLGNPVTIVGAYRKVGRAWIPLLGALLLSGLISIGLFIWWLVPCVGWLTGLGILLFFTMVIIPLIAPIVVLERQSATGAIRRAWDLARRRFWWVLGFVFVLFLFGALVVNGPAVLVVMLLDWASGNAPGVVAGQSVLHLVMRTAVSSLFGLLYLPLQFTAVTLLYFDLRIRTEGFDLAVLAASASERPPEVGELTAQAPTPERGRLITKREFLYFVLLTVGFVVLYIILVVGFMLVATGLMWSSGMPRGL